MDDYSGIFIIIALLGLGLLALFLGLLIEIIGDLFE